MKHAFRFEIESQPNDSSCGPTCLAAVYRYWNDPVDLQSLIRDIGQLSGGGTLAVQLACHALARGYQATITTYNLQMFDPSWFRGAADTRSELLTAKLNAQYDAKRAAVDVDQARLQFATNSYLKFLATGGQLEMLPLNEELIVRELIQEKPILCGLSATYLYQEKRERNHLPDAFGRTSTADDVGGFPAGHFVVLHGLDPNAGEVLIADPLHPNPLAAKNNYRASLARVTSSILLGILTFDANLLTIVPRTDRSQA